MPQRANRSATVPSRQPSVQGSLTGSSLPLRYSTLTSAIWKLENQYSVTIFKKPPPTRPRIRSVIWQQPLSKRGNVQGGDIETEPQRKVTYSHREHVYREENMPRAKSTMWQNPQRKGQNYQGDSKRARGYGNNQQADAGPSRKYDHREYERHRQLEQVPQSKLNTSYIQTPTLWPLFYISPCPLEQIDLTAQPATLEIPITDLHHLSKLNSYRHSLGLGPSKNLISSAIYDHDPSAVDSFYQQKDVTRHVSHISDNDAEDLSQVREALQNKCKRKLCIGFLRNRASRNSSGNIYADSTGSSESS
ncbi:hypothetical protein RRF57_000105 [Xylaria bambusicola]|uniref:Uncharacterized protein n=1 Tax=Xylaria bambusicola TaxID=326684 RepID=A0AAN7UE02_9PEZI